MLQEIAAHFGGEGKARASASVLLGAHPIAIGPYESMVYRATAGRLIMTRYGVMRLVGRCLSK
jgi:hypothetical protein